MGRFSLFPDSWTHIRGGLICLLIISLSPPERIIMAAGSLGEFARILLMCSEGDVTCVEPKVLGPGSISVGVSGPVQQLKPPNFIRHNVSVIQMRLRLLRR